MSKTIECEARRHSEMWVASIPQHGVYGCGRTLRALHDNLIQGLTLMGVTAHVTTIPVSPELDRLRRAKAAYDTALAQAVAALATHGSTVSDTAEATGIPIARVTALQAKPPTPLARTSRMRKRERDSQPASSSWLA